VVISYDTPNIEYYFLPPDDFELKEFALKLIQDTKAVRDQIPEGAKLEKLTTFFMKVALFNAFQRGLKDGTPEHDKFIDDYLTSKLGDSWYSLSYTHY
jgi:hypothetical protein